jgi:hypothetical protein
MTKSKLEEMAEEHWCKMDREESEELGYIAGFKACIAEAEKMAFMSNDDEDGERVVSLDDLKKLVGEG